MWLELELREEELDAVAWGRTEDPHTLLQHEGESEREKEREAERV